VTFTDLDALKEQLTRHEGMSLRAYVDTTGHITIGVGRNLTDVGITQEEANAMLEHDIARTIGAVTLRWPWWERLDPIRQRVLVNMAFNLGVDGLAGFQRFLEYVRTGFYLEAAAEMVPTKWSRQVGPRADELAAMMRTGTA
jgi:lysozyme